LSEDARTKDKRRSAVGYLANLGFRSLGAVHGRVYRLTGGTIGGRVAKMPVLLLTTTGRRSGQPRTQPLTYTRAGQGYAVIASKGGAAHHPLWYLNLQTDPLAEITVGRETYKMRARDATGEERDRLWRELTHIYPGYDRYAARTTRQIPVVVLERTGSEEVSRHTGGTGPGARPS